MTSVFNFHRRIDRLSRRYGVCHHVTHYLCGGANCGALYSAGVALLDAQILCRKALARQQRPVRNDNRQHECYSRGDKQLPGSSAVTVNPDRCIADSFRAGSREGDQR